MVQGTGSHCTLVLIPLVLGTGKNCCGTKDIFGNLGSKN